MNFIKKMCILRQIRQGFSGDGKVLSGLVKIEQYGKNLSVEVSIINFAPLSSGEYYCLIADSRSRTEMLPLRGKSVFNIVSELNAEDGFCAVICFVKNGIVPIAYGVNGQRAYDWRTLVRNMAPPAKEEKDPPYEAPATATAAPRQPQTETAPPEKYDDESLARENYYSQEEEIHERVENDKPDTYAYTESGDQTQATQERESSPENGDAENIRHPFETDSDGYYLAVKGEIDALFDKYPADDSLKSAFASSEWVRIRGDEGRAEYLVGVIYDDLKARYICYALPAKDPANPPEEIREVCTFVPSSAFSDKEGFFVIFQSCATGECIRAENA